MKLNEMKWKQKRGKLFKIFLAGLISLGTLEVISSPQTINAKDSLPTMMTWENAKGKLNPEPYTINQIWEGNKLYWGEKDGVPLRWWILNVDESGFGNAGGILIQGATPLEQVSHEPNNTYTGSAVETYLKSTYESSLTDDEKNATLTSSRNELGYLIDGLKNTFSDDIKNNKWFAPTVRMLTTTAYGFSSSNDANKSRALDFDVVRKSFWTSSSTYSNGIGVVMSNGNIIRHLVGHNDCVLPASILDTNKILFVSSANGGKAGSLSGDDKLAAITNGSSNEWKFTLKDNGQSIDSIKVNRTAKDKVEVVLNKKGKGTSISAVATDETSGGMTHYGRVLNVSGSDADNVKATITLPDEVINGTSNLKIFTEVYNGEFATDYASDLYDVTIPPYEVTGTYNYRNADGSLTTTVADKEAEGQKFADLVNKPTLTNPVEGYRLTDVTNPWQVATPGFDKDNVQIDFTADAQYTSTYKVKLITDEKNSSGYYIGIVDSGRNLGVEGVGESNPIGRDAINIDGAFTPYGYRFTHWEYTNLDGSSIDEVDKSKANVKNVQMDFLAKAKYIKTFDVEFSDGQGNLVNVIDNGGNILKRQKIDLGGDAILPTIVPTKPYYNFTSWDGAKNIQKDKLLGADPITPIYSPYKYTIDSTYGLYAFKTTESKNVFANLTNDEIDDRLIQTYLPKIYRDGNIQTYGEEKNSNDGTYKDKVTLSGVDYKNLRNGTKGEFEFTIHYRNKKALKLDNSENAFKDDINVVVKIADNTSNGKKARIAANNFTLNINDVKSLKKLNVINFASAQAYGDDGQMGNITVDAASLSAIPVKTGVYPLQFNCEVMLNGKLETISTIIDVTVEGSVTESDEIKKIDKEDTHKDNQVNTGDTTMIFPIMLLLVVSGVVLVWCKRRTIK